MAIDQVPGGEIPKQDRGPCIAPLIPKIPSYQTLQYLENKS